MVKRCAYGTCKTDSRYLPADTDVKFFPFPKPFSRLEDCKRWIKACGRPNKMEKNAKSSDILTPERITKNTYVCSKVRGVYHYLIGHCRSYSGSI